MEALNKLLALLLLVSLATASSVLTMIYGWAYSLEAGAGSFSMGYSSQLS